jgi:hypothetical protein
MDQEFEDIVDLARMIPNLPTKIPSFGFAVIKKREVRIIG